MAKLGFELPYELEVRLRRHVSWGKKGKLIEGLIILAVENADQDDGHLIKDAMRAYHDTHK